MSKVRDEIRLYAKDEDKPILNWLFGRYHWASQWSFVAACSHVRYGDMSYQTHRVWTPTVEGRAVHNQLSGGA